jgi:hypothetical protein
MPIQLLTSADRGAYELFRRRLWPYHSGAGFFEAAEFKYYLNPIASLCPGSGLYGYFQGDKLCGIMGAYPMPITLDGAVHPGHMLVDWAVLPDLRFSPIAGLLWNELFKLAGRKFASRGSRFSQGPLQKRGVKINSMDSVALVSPLRSIVARLLHISYSYSYPSPLLLDKIKICSGVELIEGGQIRSSIPPHIEKTAWIYHGPGFWELYCSARMYTGAICLRVRTDKGEADLVLTLRETGESFRFASLLSAQFVPYTVECAASVGRSLRAFLRGHRIGLLFATETDPELAAFLNNVAWYVHRSPSYWWSIPKITDEFRHEDVSWRLTSADRDSHFGGVQPWTEA